MNRQKRRTSTKTRQSTAAKRRVQSPGTKRRGAAAAKTKRAASKTRVAIAQKRAAEIFEQQINDVWSRFGQEFVQFAEGFNTEIGAHQLHVQINPDTIVASLAMSGELLVQLDQEHKHVACWISSQCGDFGSCIVEQPPIGLTIEDDRLRLAFGSTAFAEDDLAVKLLTELVQIDPSQSQPPRNDP